MIFIKLLVEGLGLGFLICLYCALGIRKGAVGMVHLYSSEVQSRVVELGMTTKEKIRTRGKILKAVSAATYLIYLVISVYIINGARGFITGFLQIFVVLEVANLIDRFVVDEFWVGHSDAWIIPGTEDLRPYITTADKVKKWIAGTLGFAVIAAAAAGIIQLIIR